MKNETTTPITVQIETNLLEIFSEVEKDLSKILSEALQLWTEEKILKCPINNEFCTNIHGQCNICNRARVKAI